jgi:hypothetical protein
VADKSASGAHVQKNRIFAALRYVPQKTREILQTCSGIFCQTDAIFRFTKNKYVPSANVSRSVASTPP